MATKQREVRKYNNIKTKVGALSFDSRREADRHYELSLLARAGEISNLERQPKYVLQPSFKDREGVTHRAITYTADFGYMTKKGELIVEDVKSKITAKLPAYIIKKKMFIRQHPHIIFKEVF